MKPESITPTSQARSAEISMNGTIEILERHGLISVELARVVLARMPLRKIISLSGQLLESIEEEDPRYVYQPSIHGDPFSFLASASLRGDAGCSAVECRSRTLSLLSRYSALYCDHVAVPFGLHIDPELGVDRARRDLLERLVTIIELRPVIEAGIARLFIPSRCNHCMQKLPLGIGIAKMARRLAAEQFNNFSATYSPWEYGFDVRLQGPSEYLDHGALVQPYDDVPEWVPKRIVELREQAEGRKVSSRTLRRSRLVEELFETIAVDVIHQRLEAEHRPLNYLMGRRGEAEFLSRLNSDHELEQRTAALCAHLAHTVPTLMDVPLSSVSRSENASPRALLITATRFEVLFRNTSKQVARCQKRMRRKSTSTYYARGLTP